MVTGRGRDQIICMNDPRTWKMERELTVSEKGGLDGGGK